MKLSVIRTSSSLDRSHRTLIVVTRRFYTHVWVHAFERPWGFHEAGMLCFGCGFISFNIFDLTREPYT